MKRSLFILAVTMPMAFANAESSAAKSQPATDFTKKVQQQYQSSLPFQNREDFDRVKKGLVEAPTNLEIKDDKGNLVWGLQDYTFLNADKAPDTVNPSLWRVSQLNATPGLFKVTEGIYQIRGYDLSNMSIIEGKNGIIIIDPLTATETAKAGLELYYKNRPHNPVVAVIYTHSHVDHFGGVKGVVSEEDVKKGKVKILGPEHFMEEAISEAVYAGNAMSRRAIYMYGALLPKGDKGQVDGGLGKTVSLGTVSLIAPTDEIKKTGEKRTIAGVEMEFQMAPHTEAPAEMLIYFPQHKALCAAEDVTHTLHNLYTLRGAQVRDAVSWWKDLNYTNEKFVPKTDVIFASHHWPTWGNQEVRNLVESERDAYKFLNDQALNFMNKGYMMTELPDKIRLPDKLAQNWENRGYYGTVNHNSKAVYQKYLGWYSSNPADLNPLPPLETAKRTVEFMGGEKSVISKARASYKKGDYRWVAQVLTNVVYANPKNQEARNLEADALEQLGYQSESGPWRNEYLVGAFELRNGIPNVEGTQTASPDMIGAMDPEMLLDYLSIRVNGERANGKNIKGQIHFNNTKKDYAIELRNSVIIYTMDKKFDKPDFSIEIADQSDFGRLIMIKGGLDQVIKEKRAKVPNGQDKLKELVAMLDDFPPMFPIITRELDQSKAPSGSHMGSNKAPSVKTASDKSADDNSLAQ
jgi:alkyl sulfatase BDS1-like metallo-beta-lactamase superfamily hydrolase